MILFWQEAASKVCEDEQKSSRQFIQRLFPDLKKKLSAIPQEQWTSEAENVIVNYLSNLQKPQETEVVDFRGDVEKLQTQVSYYKTVIDDTVSGYFLNRVFVYIFTVF